MSRDHTKLRFFPIADSLTLRVYRATEFLPATERYGLQSQMRRAAVSVVTNVVEGACRRTDKAYSQFLEIALGSASELEYHLLLSADLEYFLRSVYDELNREVTGVKRMLSGLLNKLKADSR